MSIDAKTYQQVLQDFQDQQQAKKWQGHMSEKAFKADMFTLQNVVQQVLVPAMREQFRKEIEVLKLELKTTMEECRSVKQELEALRVAVMTVCLQGAGLK